MFFNILLCKILVLTSAAPLISDNTNTTVTDDLETKPSYEITENIVDIPDTRPKLPIIANYSVQTPLNLAKPTNLTNPTSGEKSTKFSILQIHAETDDKQDFTEVNEKDLFNNIKTAFKGLKKSILTSIHSWLEKKIGEHSA